MKTVVKGNASRRASAAKPNITAASIIVKTDRVRKLLKRHSPFFPVKFIDAIISPTDCKSTKIEKTPVKLTFLPLITYVNPGF
jgi:hypothetical protein